MLYDISQMPTWERVAQGLVRTGTCACPRARLLVRVHRMSVCMCEEGTLSLRISS